MPNHLPDLVDNKKVTLAEVLRTLLQPNAKLDLAVAYFNIKAFNLLGDVLDELAEMRLLLGKEQEREFILAGEEPGTQDESESLGKDIFEELEKESAQADPEFSANLKRVYQILQKEEIKVRKYNEAFLHGKAYIIKDLKGVLDKVGIVGSSNFTTGGLKTNRELNAVLKQSSAVNELIEWFEPLWEASDDYKGELLQLFQPFLKTYSPYEIYIKILYEYRKDKFKGVCNSITYCTYRVY